eukprot:COSAG04_NODE_435_length_14466_cov_135.545486_17_plen_95_part_00
MRSSVRLPYVALQALRRRAARGLSTLLFVGGLTLRARADGPSVKWSTAAARPALAQSSKGAANIANMFRTTKRLDQASTAAAQPRRTRANRVVR